jgi:hypothetical protein
MSQYRDVLFVVFTGFFVLIGVASLAVLLGFIKTADSKFRNWAITGFLAGVTTAIYGVFKTSFTLAPIVVSLVPPVAMSAPLKNGMFEYDESPAAGEVVTRTGRLSPVLRGAGWEIHLPGEAAANPTRLHLQDDNGGWWTVGPFFPNYVSQEMRTGKPYVPVSDASRHPFGMAVVSAAELGPAVQEQAEIKFNNYARRIRDRYQRPFYEWRIFVDEPPAVLATITHVDYVLHPTFPEPFQTSRDRDKQFELTASGWGGFTILINVHHTNGREAKTSYFLDLQKAWPGVVQKTTDVRTETRSGK